MQMIMDIIDHKIESFIIFNTSEIIAIKNETNKDGIILEIISLGESLII